MDKLSMLRARDIVINDNLSIHVPTIGEIDDVGEKSYFAAVHAICATPSDYKVQLDDLKMDWEEVEDFQLFLMNRGNIDADASKLLFCGIDLAGMLKAIKVDTRDPVICTESGDVVIDDAVYMQIVDAIRQIHGLERRVDRPGNAITKRHMLTKERKLIERRKSEKFESILAPIVSAIVNTPGVNYNYDTVFDLTIFQFMDALACVRKEKAHTSLMRGVYAGTVDSKKLSSDALQWP